MRTVRVILRRKSQSRDCVSVKVCVNVRIPGRRTPKQLYLGYVSLLRPDIQPGRRRIIQAHLEAHWVAVFGNRDVRVDWEHAGTKLRELVTSLFARSDAGNDKAARPA